MRAACVDVRLVGLFFFSDGGLFSEQVPDGCQIAVRKARNASVYNEVRQSSVYWTNKYVAAPPACTRRVGARESMHSMLLLQARRCSHVFAGPTSQHRFWVFLCINVDGGMHAFQVQVNSVHVRNVVSPVGEAVIVDARSTSCYTRQLTKL